MSYVLSRKDYSLFREEFAPVNSVSRSLGANIGRVWRELLSLNDETVQKVTGFVSRGSNVYALVSDDYEDKFNILSWIESKIDFKSKVAITPFNYTLVFGEGSLPRSVEEILDEIKSVKAVNPAPVSSTPKVDYSEYDSDGATSILVEDYFSLKGDGLDFSVFDEGAEYILGRGSSADFHVVGKGISRSHLKLRYNLGSLEVLDLGSTNGTRVNGQRIPSREWVGVSDGGSIRVGRITLSVRKVEE